MWRRPHLIPDPMPAPISQLLLGCVFALGVSILQGAAPADEAGVSPGLTVMDLRCDSAVNPLGVDSAPPKLSWKLASDERGQRETAWQVLVATTPEKLAAGTGDVWDSGRQSGDAQIGVPYAGRALRTSEQVFWKVRAWDRNGHPSAWSEAATWTMGVLGNDDWSARWITDPELLRWARPKVGYHSKETGDEKEVKWVALDLGDSYLISTVRLYPLRQLVEEAQGLPIRFKIEVANNPDFQDAAVVADYSEKNFAYATTTQKTTVPTFHATGEGVNGRYVRVITSQLRRDGKVHYLALSQIEVLSHGRNVAAGARVWARDSVESGPWSAQAITDGLEIRGLNPRENGALLARREFTTKSALRRAIVHVTGLGQYELTLNGQRVGEDLLTPGWTTYEKTVLYDTYDVTNLVGAGKPNALGLTLAGGMYNVRAGRYVKFESLFRPLKAILQLRLEYSDGRVEFVGTDDQWKVHGGGPITFSNVYGGEDYDARALPHGWDSPGFDDASWTQAAATEGPGGVLRGSSHAAAPIRRHETLRPVTVTLLLPGVSVYDLGQNVSLMPRLRVRGSAGAVVRIIPAELVKPDGSVDRGSCSRGEGLAWWQYTLRGSEAGAVEEWFPQFFYHGSRYLQVELTAGADGALPVVESLEGVVVHTASEPAGEFACSNELFNRTRTLIRWAQRSNLVSLITDCPHREKLGWLEQYHLNGPALRYEFDLTRLYTKTFGDMADAQTASGLVPDIAPEFVIFSHAFRDSPEWGSAIILAAWQHYEFTGDDTPLRRYFDAMQRYVRYLDGKADGCILSYGLGDWYDIGPRPPGISQLTPIGLTATAVYYEDVKTLGTIATILGRPDEARGFAARAEEIRAAFNRKFFDAQKGVYATGSQCANAIALVFDLVAPADRGRVLDAIVAVVRSRGLTAGDVGYRYLLRALADGGRSDVIFAMNNQSEKPGYGYQLAHGATSLTEAWDAGRGSSQNHFMLGQIMEWFYRDLAGIAPDPSEPGFKRVVIRPQPIGDLAWARASYEAPRGRIVSAWRREGGQIELKVAVPVGATAIVHVPTDDPTSVREGGRAITERMGVQEVKNQSAVYTVGSGSYTFTASFR